MYCYRKGVLMAFFHILENSEKRTLKGYRKKVIHVVLLLFERISTWQKSLTTYPANLCIVIMMANGV